VRAPQQERSAARVATLVATARRLVQEQPDQPLTTRSVAAAAGVPIPTLYRYFADIDELLDVLVHEHADASADALERALGRPHASAVEVYEAVLDAHLALYRERPDLTQHWRSKQLADRQAEVEAASDLALAGRVAAHLLRSGLVAGPRSVVEARTAAHWNAAGQLLGALLQAPAPARRALGADLQVLVRTLAQQLDGTD
jgi:AcrR family transcriptional regulator